VQRRDVAFSASLTTSPVALKIGEKKLLLEDARVLTDGMLKGKTFSGKSTVSAGRLQYADYSFQNARSAFELDYEENVLKIKGPKVETEGFSCHNMVD
jgi:hypothetical protein